MRTDEIDWDYMYNYILTIERMYIDKLLTAADDDEFYCCIFGAYDHDNERTTP